ncbi:MAG: hypothetical protein ACFFEY_08640 [Candidatus Thorarchaeota archaeon]
MFHKLKNKNLILLLVVLLIPLLSNVILPNLYNNGLNDIIKSEKLKTSSITRHTIFFENPTFEGIGEPWESRIEGDYRDVIGSITAGQANYKIIGDSRYFELDEALNDSKWIATKNPDLPILPDVYEINSSGCYVSHLWHEDINQTRNRPSVQWRRTIEMPVDMRDYIITSATLETEFNATVTVSPWNNGGIDREGDTGLDDYSTGDYAEFYVLLSDEEETFPPVRVAYNHTEDLGQDGTSGIYTDTPMSVVPQNVLKSILTSILETDGHNFTITLGIDIYCEDNEINVDIDKWNSLIIRNFKLNFSYEKKIDQFTSLSFEQIGDQITGTNVEVTSANVSFKYKIDSLWPNITSPNSEIRILINNNSLSETIKLSTASPSFKLAKEEGFDVRSLILKDNNITLSIQVYLADEFGLGQNITISIDDVYFNIAYIRIFADFFSEPWVFAALLVFASIIVAGISGYLIAYQRFLKYPRPVRKVMKYRRTLNRVEPPDVVIMPKDIAFKKAYDREILESSKFLKTAPIGVKVSEEPNKGVIEKENEKTIESEELITKSLEKREELDKLVERQSKKPEL